MRGMNRKWEKKQSVKKLFSLMHCRADRGPFESVKAQHCQTGHVCFLLCSQYLLISIYIDYFLLSATYE